MISWWLSVLVAVGMEMGEVKSDSGPQYNKGRN